MFSQAVLPYDASYTLPLEDRRKALTCGLVMAWCGSSLAGALIWNDGLRWASGHPGIAVPGCMLALIIGTALVNVATATASCTPLWSRRPLIKLYTILLCMVALLQALQASFFVSSVISFTGSAPRQSVQEWWSGAFAGASPRSLAVWAATGIAACVISVGSLITYAVAISRVAKIHTQFVQTALGQLDFTPPPDYREPYAGLPPTMNYREMPLSRP